jgi:hypothetical protein
MQALVVAHCRSLAANCVICICFEFDQTWQVSGATCGMIRAPQGRQKDVILPGSGKPARSLFQIGNCWWGLASG